MTFFSARFILSPYLAWNLVDALQRRPSLLEAARRAVPPRLAASAGHLLFSRELWRAFFVVLLMAVLGNLAMAVLNAYLASMPFSSDRAAAPSA